MYANKNFKTKKAFKEAVAAGEQITLYSPGMGQPKTDGIEYVEGPWYPKPHSWYAEVIMKSGIVIKIK